MPIISGTPNADVIVGTLGDDTIVGMSGDDSILGGRGDNIIFGNQGNDTLRAGRGQDTLLGGKGNDKIFGSEQDNILSGDDGDDTLFAIDGENILFGGPGNDVLVAGLGNDFLYGGQGNDTLWAERGNNVVSGDRGANVLIGGTGENIFVLNINHGGPSINDADQILRFKPNDKIALLGGPEGQTIDRSAINIAFVRRDGSSSRGNYVLTNLATGEFLAVIHNVRRSALTAENFTEDLTPSDTPDPGPPQPPVVDPEDELPPAPDPGDTTTEPQPPPTDGPGVPPVIEPPVDEDDPEDPGAEDPGAEDPTNNPPEARNNEAEVSEDGPAIEIDVLANDSDPDDDPLTITSFTGVTDGVTVTIEGDPPTGSDPGNQRLLYDPGEAFQFLIDGETRQDTFTYTINDGRGGTATATVTVTILGADDLPTSENGSVEVLTGATFSFSAADFVFNDPDEGDDFQAIKLVSSPDAGTLTFASNPVNVDDIIPVADLGSLEFAQGTLGVGDSTSFDFRVKNTRDFLSDESYTMTLGIVANPNAPKIDLDGDAATGIVEALNREYLEGPVGDITELSFAEDVRFDLPDGNSLSEVVVTLNGIEDVDEVLSLSTSIAGIAVTGDGTTEVTLTNTGSASVDNFQTLLRQITYKNDGIDTDNPTEGPRTVTIRAVDDGGLESNPAIVTIDVIAVNDPPSIHGNGVTQAATTGEAYNLGNLFATEAFSDPDAGDEDVIVSLSVDKDADGTFNYTGSTLTDKLTDLNSNSLTITAPISEINTAIQNGNLRYVPSVDSDFDLEVTINDDGNSGSVGHNTPGTAETTFTIPIQNLAGITEMTVTTLPNWGNSVSLPASAFLAVGRGNDIRVSNIDLVSGIQTNKIQSVDPSGNEVTFNLASFREGNSTTGQFTYTLEVDGQNVETDQTVTVKIKTPPGSSGSFQGGDGPSILRATGSYDLTLIGGSGDDYLMSSLGSRVLYGGQGNDTLVGPVGNDVNNTDNLSDTFVFDKDDVLTRPGFNAESIADIRNHVNEYGVDKILTFNLGNSKGWSFDNPTRNDVIWLSNFGIGFDNVNPDVGGPAGDGSLGNRLNPDTNVFAVFSPSGGGHPEALYLLYDKSGDNTVNSDTYLIAKLTGNSDTFGIAPDGLRASDFRFDTFESNP
ncbi:Ig-like domain-containing protein [Sodalinema gerasimenkoae]|uniref:Ig-like domain-containing protein n=1 Tax=Sodalinema gerasimenkoae TaxID=2862348 RepID=UPI00135818F1|nr:Ig-like domain-containing protein [Sodalinema gerasimenkoae]